MTRSELVESVKVKLDESTPDGVSHSFDEYIEPMLDEAAKSVCDTVPIHLLTPTEIPVVKDTNLFYEDDLAHIQVPSDFSRIYKIKFATWKKPVYELLIPGSPEYLNQDNLYLKSNVGRPTVKKQHKVVGDEDLSQYLICGKVSQGIPVEEALYVKYVNAEDMPTLLHEAIAWLTASKVLNITGEVNPAKYAEQEYLKNIASK